MWYYNPVSRLHLANTIFQMSMSLGASSLGWRDFQRNCVKGRAISTDQYSSEREKLSGTCCLMLATNPETERQTKSVRIISPSKIRVSNV